MRIYPICSSSKGNCVYIGERDSGILIDAGCSFRAIRTGLELAGMELSCVKAVLITHEHTDHVNGLLQFTKHTRIPVYAGERTLEYLTLHNLVDTAAELRLLSALSGMPLDYDVSFFHTPHDSNESVGYIIDTGKIKIGFCTDLGHVTNEVSENLLGCKAVFLEANYEPALLNANPNYPAYLKNRIAGKNGHLSNNDSGVFCRELISRGAVSIILGHLSQENNTPDTALTTVKSILSSYSIGEEDCIFNVAPVKNETGSFYSL